jgi:hypothetical protein
VVPANDDQGQAEGLIRHRRPPIKAVPDNVDGQTVKRSRVNIHQQDHIGQLVAWGANHVGQAGHAPGPDLAAPLVVAGLPPVKAVCVNAAAMLALDADGRGV